jgi:hypothetical protein
MGCGRAGTLALEWGIDPSASRPGDCGCGGEPCPCGCTGRADELREFGVWQATEGGPEGEPSIVDWSRERARIVMDTAYASDMSDGGVFGFAPVPPATNDCTVRKSIPSFDCGDIAAPLSCRAPASRPGMGCFEYYTNETHTACDPFYSCELLNPVSAPYVEVPASPMALDEINPCREGSSKDVETCARRANRPEGEYTLAQAQAQLRREGAIRFTTVKPASENRVCGDFTTGTHYTGKDSANNRVGSIICCPCCKHNAVDGDINNHCVIA